MEALHLIHSIIVVMNVVQGTLSWDCQNETIAPVLVWWEQKPLVFSGNKSARNFQVLEGLLPELWPTVASRCRDVLPQSCLDSLDHRQVNKTQSKSAFLEVIGSRDLLMPVKLRGNKESVLGMPFVKLLDSPGVAVIMKNAVTGTDLFKAILMTWPILIFVVLSALLSGFFIWFLVSLFASI